jgi:hypothetical protein
MNDRCLDPHTVARFVGLLAPANRRDDGLLAATLDGIAVVGSLPTQPMVHLDAGYDYQPCRQVLADRGMVGQIATRGIPAPIRAGRRWVIERTHAWGNQYGKLRWCTERRRLVVGFWLALASAVIVLGRLIRRAWTHYRWDGRPPRRPWAPVGAASLCSEGLMASLSAAMPSLASTAAASTGRCATIAWTHSRLPPT